MFGENSIYGNSVAKCDSKSRLVLPSFTGTEEGDELVLLRQVNGIKVVSVRQMDNIVDKLTEAISLCPNQTEREVLEFKLYETYKCVIKTCKADKQRRIAAVEGLEANQEYELTGQKDSLLLTKKVRG